MMISRGHLSIAVLSLAVSVCFAKQLTKESFKELVGSDKNVFVKFYAPWCPHCVQLEPTWAKLTEATENNKDLATVVAKVDCTDQGDLCTKEGVQGYPTLKLYRANDKSGSDYEGPRELNSLVEFLNKQLSIALKVADDEEKLPLADPVAPGDDSQNEVDGDNAGGVSVAAPKNGMHELIDVTVDDFLKEGRHFVEFYAPWCGHCQRLVPIWEQLAQSFENDELVRISKIDCNEFREACKPWGVRGYPSLLWIVDGKVIEKYQGERTHEALKKFVLDKVEADLATDGATATPDLVATLTDQNFDKTIKSGVTFVEFYAPWCGHCKSLAPIWDDLAKKMHGTADFRLAKVDCNQFEKLCDQHKVDGFPTLLLFKDGAQVVEYESDRSLETLHAFVLKHISKPKDEL
ncbi:Thioredoxin domain-containing protein 5 [Halotydeus destructor]|nr:Thioredoxin domain-containing protein 5 [Halotydeus destructor]